MLRYTVLRCSVFAFTAALVTQASAEPAAPMVHLDDVSVETGQRAAPTTGPTGIAGYTATAAPVATKTNTPLDRVPASVSVVTRENLDDRNVQSLSEALAYTPGAATNLQGFDPRYDNIYIRGFGTINNGIYRDGLRDLNATAFFINEPYGLDAVAILRGPAAATYGYGSPGGIVDVTSKRPVFSSFGEVQLQIGNFARRQGNFDIGGPVAGSDGKLAYRLTGVFRDSQTFPTGPDDRIDIAPAFTYSPDGSTDFTFLSGYDKSRTPGSSGFFYGPNYTVTDIKFGDPAFNKIALEQYRLGYAFEHRFSSELIIRQNFRYAALDQSWRYTNIDGIAADGLSALRSVGLLYQKQATVQVDNQIETHLDIGPTRHVLLAGLDYAHADADLRQGYGPAPSLNLVTLNYGQQAFTDPAIVDALTTHQRQDTLGEYLQDQITWDRATLTLSGRHDTVTTTTDTGAGLSTPQSDDAFTGRAGLNYAVLPGLVPYASYATTFSPNLGTDAAGTAFQAQRGDQKEVGLKTTVPDTNLHINGALFDIVESSVLRTDPTNIAFSAATGKVRSRGYEIEAVDNIAPGTNFTAQLTHIDLRFVDNTAETNGKQLSGIPGTTVSAFLNYKIPLPGAIGGLSLGGGIRYLGSSFADDINTATDKPVALFDAVLGYDFGVLSPTLHGTRFQLNAYNLFDTYSTTCQSGYCYRRGPLQVIGSLIHRW